MNEDVFTTLIQTISQVSRPFTFDSELNSLDFSKLTTTESEIIRMLIVNCYVKDNNIRDTIRYIRNHNQDVSEIGQFLQIMYELLTATPDEVDNIVYTTQTMLVDMSQYLTDYLPVIGYLKNIDNSVRELSLESIRKIPVRVLVLLHIVIASYYGSITLEGTHDDV